MKQLKNSASISLGLCILLAIFTAFGSYRASAAPQPLPFDFLVPALGDLEWRLFSPDGSDTPLSGSCSDGTGINIRDAIDSNGNTDAYDRAWLSATGGQAIGTGGVGDLAGSTYNTVPVNISNLDITYQLYFSDQVQCNRLLLIFDNNTGAQINESVQISTNFGTGTPTTDATSSGGTIFSTADRWIVTSGQFSRPVNTTVFYGPGSPISTPTFATDQVCEASTTSGVGVELPISVPAGQSRCLMLFGCLGNITDEGNTVAGAIAAAQLFNRNDTIPPDLLSGLSQQQLEECVNWNFAPRSVPTLSEWGLIAMAGILGIVGFMVIRRRKVTA